MNWNHYASLLAVLDHGSLSSAARELGVTQPTLSRHVDEVERALGRTLFVRSHAGLQPTETAHQLEPLLRQMGNLDQAIVRAASSGGTEEVRGTVRVSASEVVGVELLPAIFSTLGASHPALELELSLSNRLEDLARHDADIAVRMVRPTDNALVLRHVGESHVGMYAHRDYADRHELPTCPEALQTHRLIGFDRLTPALRTLLKQTPSLAALHFHYRSSSDLAQLALLRAGAGIGFCQRRIATRNAALIPVLPAHYGFPLPIYLVTHEDLRHEARIRAVMDALGEGLA